MQIEPERRLNLIAEHIKSESESSVVYQSVNQTVVVTMNRPKALNSINLEMVRSLSKNLEFINSHQVAWFQGSGGRSFCAGGDVKAIFEKEATVQDRKIFFREEFNLDYSISQLNAIQISCWDGIVMGGGVGVSGFAPFIIATEKTLFAMPEAKLGFFTDVGVNYTLARLRNSLGYYLGMTGSRLKGEQVYIAGLANFFIPSSKIPEVRQEVLTLFKSSKKVENTREEINSILKKYHSPSGKTVLQNQQKIKELFSLPSATEIYLKAKSKSDDFSKNITKLLEEQCPVSVQLIHRLIALSKSSTLREVFAVDQIVVEHMCSNKDMREGVRCVLMEKGAVPQWSRESIPSVEKQVVQNFLIPIKESSPRVN